MPDADNQMSGNDRLTLYRRPSVVGPNQSSSCTRRAMAGNWLSGSSTNQNGFLSAIWELGSGTSNIINVQDGRYRNGERPERLTGDGRTEGLLGVGRCPIKWPSA